LKNCAIISFLLVATGLTWNVYQDKQERIARQEQQEIPQPSEPTVDEKTELVAVFSEEEP
jgi:hypothetical protein